MVHHKYVNNNGKEGKKSLKLEVTNTKRSGRYPPFDIEKRKTKTNFYFMRARVTNTCIRLVCVYIHSVSKRSSYLLRLLLT